jgi:hypothetical protein
MSQFKRTGLIRQICVCSNASIATIERKMPGVAGNYTDGRVPPSTQRLYSQNRYALFPFFPSVAVSPLEVGKENS